MNESSTDYQLFLNLVLWNTPHFQFLSRDRDYLQWKGILTHAFHQFVHAYPDFEFIFDGHYSAPAFQREYIQLKLRELEFSNDRAERLSLILQNYLSVSYDATFPQPQKRFIGRDEYGQVYAQPTTFSEQYQKRLKFLFLFMLFNGALTRAEIKNRITAIAAMLQRNREKIECIYFNTYLTFFGLPNPQDVVPDLPYTIYDDITISSKMTESGFRLCGTFSKNYSLVELLTYDEISAIASLRELELTSLHLHSNHIHFALWNLGLSPSSFDMSGITIASEFCPTLKFQ